MLWGVKDAYWEPTIRVFHRLGEIWEEYSVFNALQEGTAGIMELERKWPEAVENFRKEIANL